MLTKIKMSFEEVAVSKLIAGTGISISPVAGTGTVTVTNTGLPQNVVRAKLAGIRDTSSVVLVSTGFGLQITSLRGNPILIHAMLKAGIYTGGQTRAKWQVFRSTVGIPLLGTVPPGGDTGLALFDEDLSSQMDIMLPYEELDSNANVTGTVYFYYLAFAGLATTILSLLDAVLVAHEP